MGFGTRRRRHSQRYRPTCPSNTRPDTWLDMPCVFPCCSTRNVARTNRQGRRSGPVAKTRHPPITWMQRRLPKTLAPRMISVVSRSRMTELNPAPRTKPLSTSHHLTALSPHLTSPHHTSTPHLTAPHLTTPPHLTSPHLTLPLPHLPYPPLPSPHLTAPHRTAPHHTSPRLASPHLTSPPAGCPPAPQAYIAWA